MGRSKLQRYAENAESPYVLEPGKPSYENIRGKWNERYFHNNHPIVLELACGRAEYTVGMAQMYPEKNFIGVDIKGARLWKGSRQTDEMQLSNTAFLRTHIQNIENFFDKDEVDDVWITFPDPRPRERDAKRRLISAYFLDKYKRILKPEGCIHLKTDNTDLFDFALNEVHEFGGKPIIATKHLYGSPLYVDELKIKTTYEEKFGQMGYNINYLKFTLN